MSRVAMWIVTVLFVLAVVGCEKKAPPPEQKDLKKDEDPPKAKPY